MAAVQFFGTDQVLNAAENLNCPAWGIFAGRNLFSKYEGSEMSESLAMLSQNLEMLSNSGTAAIYTIKFFESDKGKPVKINERSVCDGGSFNFKLIEPEQREMMLIRNSSQYGVIGSLEKKIEALEKQLAERDDNKDDEEEPENIGSIIIGLLKNPDQLGQLVNIGRAALGLPVQNLGTIGAIPATIEADETGTEAKIERLGAAIDVLEKADPKLIEHLEKLAKMATDTPDQFRTMVNML